MRYQYQPKHMRELESTRVPLVTRSLRSGAAAAAVTAALLPALLATPALAATQIGIDGSTYTEAAQGTGSNGGTWSWGGRDDSPLNLDNYNGGAISWQGGDLTIVATGDNTVAGGEYQTTYRTVNSPEPQGDTSDTSTNFASIYDSTVDGSTTTFTYDKDNPVTVVSRDENGNPTATQGNGTTVETDARGNVVSEDGKVKPGYAHDLTITGGGTLTAANGILSLGDVSVDGGSEVITDGIHADGSISISGASTVTAGNGGIDTGGDLDVTGGSVLQNANGTSFIDPVANAKWAAVYCEGDMTVTDSSVDVVDSVDAASLSVTRSDFRCRDALSLKAQLTLDGSELREGSLDLRSAGSGMNEHFYPYYYPSALTRYEIDHPGEYPKDMSYYVVVSRQPTPAEKAAPSTATATWGMLAVRQTPVPAGNAPAKSDGDAVYQTFIVSSVSKDEEASGTFDLAFSIGSAYAGKTATVYVQHEDGTWQVIKDVTVGEDGRVRVTTTKLSRYTVVVKGDKASDVTEEPNTPAKPGTGTVTPETKPSAPAAPQAATTRPAAAHLSSAEAIPQTGDPFGAAPAVLAALGALAFFEAKHLRHEA